MGHVVRPRYAPATTAVPARPLEEAILDHGVNLTTSLATYPFGARGLTSGRVARALGLAFDEPER